ncbi:hypothetical protein I553_3350 [Mycobacterium xenopi 4042]|uniref:Helicase HerA-like C-terminal domain-containing protein n=1 Tax=Mycobacterium xenopi 4042 TaxID=1299334 RepID=X7YVD5_MYCXE|nr:hypothetical protein I553_3350 [Mycobacterium xenopi 4042]
MAPSSSTGRPPVGAGPHPVGHRQSARPGGRGYRHRKTKTLQLIAEQLSAAGVPVLMADVKGDLSGWPGRGVQRQDHCSREGHR